ncbi:MAG: hypothetical protein L3J74_08270 [Bacteroidales bacterium]|nr:hypothetical protein [Bacteroidales bacterium]
MNSNSFKNILFIAFVVFCIQFTELKINVIKVAEILLLCLTPFLYYKSINKWVLLFFGLFTLWFLISIALNPFRDFYLLKEVSVLKKPYFITIGRYLELISCINLMALVQQFFKNKSYEEVLFFIKQIFLLSFFLLILSLIIYTLHMHGFITETRTVYWGDRLRGWFSEGGPYGLMLGFTFVLSFFYKNKYNNIFRTIILFTIIFFAKSKAGGMLLIVWFILLYHKKMYKKIRELNIIILIVGGIITSLIFVKLAGFYIDDINNIKREVVKRPTDINLVMGRIAGLFIFPEMVVDNPIVGIGLGNYPIMRNNPEYLGFIPSSPIGKTDAHGYGGIVQLLVDGGLVILILFLRIIYLFFKKIKRNKNGLEVFLYMFLFLFIFGVQIYFLYPWILLGILISLSEKSEFHDKRYISS